MGQDHKQGYREALLQGHNPDVKWGEAYLTDADREAVEVELGLRPAPEPEPVAEPVVEAKHAEKKARPKRHARTE